MVFVTNLRDTESAGWGFLFALILAAISVGLSSIPWHRLFATAAPTTAPDTPRTVLPSEATRATSAIVGRRSHSPAIPRAYWLVALVIISAVGAGWAWSGRAERANKAGLVLLDRGDYREAIPFFARAVEIRPSMSKAHYNMGLSYAKLGHVDQAAACFRRALDADPANVAASRMLTRANAAIDSRR